MFNFFRKTKIVENRNNLNNPLKLESNDLPKERFKVNSFEKEYMDFMEHDNSRFENYNLYNKLIKLTDKVYTSDFIIYNGIEYKAGEIFQIVNVKRKDSAGVLIEGKRPYYQDYILILKDIENRELVIDLAESYKDEEKEGTKIVYNCGFHALILATIPQGTSQTRITDFNKIGPITSGNFGIIKHQTHEGLFMREVKDPDRPREYWFRVVTDSTFLKTKDISLKKLYELEVFKGLRPSGYNSHSGMRYNWEKDVYYDFDAEMDEYY